MCSTWMTLGIAGLILRDNPMRHLKPETWYRFSLSLSAGGRKYDDVTQVSKPAVSPTSQSADRPLSGRLRIWKSARQQVWKPALQNTSPNWRPGALRERESRSPFFANP